MKYLLILLLTFSLPVMAEEVYTMDVPVKCEFRRSKVRVMIKEFADTIFHTWLIAGNTTNPAKLREQAEYTAWYILRDNNSICRPRK